MPDVPMPTIEEQPYYCDAGAVRRRDVAGDCTVVYFSDHADAEALCAALNREAAEAKGAASK